MPATTINRGYPYPVDGDPIDTAGDEGRLALAIDLDALGLQGAHDAQQVQIDANQGDINFLYDARMRVNTNSMSGFEGPVYDFRLYLLTTDWAGNSNATFAAPFSSLPAFIPQLTMESPSGGAANNAVPWKQYTTLTGFTLHLCNASGGAIGSVAFEAYVMACGLYV